MIMAIFWGIFAVFFGRIMFVSARNKNYGMAVGAAVMMAWGIYRILGAAGFLPDDMVVEQTDNLLHW